MRRAVLQPAGSGDAKQHYHDTIENPVEFSAHAADLGGEMTSLLTAHPSGRAPMWGATPGAGERNVKVYERMAPGDYVFFAGDGKLFAGGTVTTIFRNPQLAAALWSFDGKGQTWELMFSLSSSAHFRSRTRR